MAVKSLWTEKYRPKTVKGYVFRDEAQRKQVETWIKDGSIPHLLFSGHAGIGKTTLAKLLLNELNVNDLDILEINASRTNSVDDVRDKIGRLPIAKRTGCIAWCHGRISHHCTFHPYVQLSKQDHSSTAFTVPGFPYR
jgi:replication-associated recombination protein RarA